MFHSLIDGKPTVPTRDLVIRDTISCLQDIHLLSVQYGLSEQWMHTCMDEWFVAQSKDSFIERLSARLPSSMNHHKREDWKRDLSWMLKKKYRWTFQAFETYGIHKKDILVS